jgi:hypothetical protein
MTLLRWLLVAPLAFVGGYIGIACAILLASAAQALCPIDQQVSGLCYAPWYQSAEFVAECVGAGIAAFCTVSFATRAAPSHRRQVAMVAMAAGTAFASWFLALGGSSLLAPYLIAILVGGATVRTWLRQSSAG